MVGLVNLDSLALFWDHPQIYFSALKGCVLSRELRTNAFPGCLCGNKILQTFELQFIK